jgi:Flp pilus assembly protein TadD
MRQGNKLLWGVLFIFILSGFLVYANSLRNPFIWDDPYLILENHYITSPRYFLEIFKRDLYYSTAGLSNYYRPLQSLFLMFDYSLWRLDPLGYHITSIVFHVGCVFLIYLLLCLLFARRVIAFLVSFLFLVHPINSTVVDYISARADSQVTFFALLSFYFFAIYLTKNGYPFLRPQEIAKDHKKEKKKVAAPVAAGRPYYFASLVCFILALLSKELGIILPFLLVVTLPIIFNIPKKILWYKAAPFFAVLGIYGVLRLSLLRFLSTAVGVTPPIYIRVITALESFVRLMGLVFVPVRMHVEKMIPFSSSFFEPRTFLSAVILAGIFVFMYSTRKSLQMCFFGLSWFFVALIPMANIMPINTTLADHWLYLPGFGFILAVVAACVALIKKIDLKMQNPAKRLAIFIYFLVFLVFSWMTIKQNNIWREPLKFYQHAIKMAPRSFRPHNEIGVIYSEQKKYDAAIIEFQKAIELNPSFDQAYDNLGIAYDMKEDFGKAIEAHKKALQINPNNIKAYNNLGNAYYKAELLDDAIASYKEAIRLNRDYKAAYNNLGAAYFKKGMFKETRSCWEKVLSMDPGFSMARDNLAILDKQENLNK